MLPPVFPALPGPGAELPAIDIAGELVALVSVEAGKTRVHKAYQLIHVPAAVHNLIGPGNEGGQRLGQEFASPGGEEGDSVIPEHALQRPSVILKAPDGYRDIPPAAAFVPHKRQRSGRGELALGGHALGPAQENGGLACKAGVGIAEHVVGKKGQGLGFFPFCFEELRLRLLPQLPAESQQLPAAPAGQLIDLAAAA